MCCIQYWIVDRQETCKEIIGHTLWRMQAEGIQEGEGPTIITKATEYGYYTEDILSFVSRGVRKAIRSLGGDTKPPLMSINQFNPAIRDLIRDGVVAYRAQTAEETRTAASALPRLLYRLPESVTGEQS